MNALSMRGLAPQSVQNKYLKQGKEKVQMQLKMSDKFMDCGKIHTFELGESIV